MKQNLIADYSICIIFKILSFFSNFLPKGFLLFLGRRLGDLIYFFDAKHRFVALANLNKAIGRDLSFVELSALLRKSYQAFGQNLVEISFIPQIDKKYLDKHIHIENKEFVPQAFNRDKGVIFLAVHEGNWELSNIICANFGFDGSTPLTINPGQSRGISFTLFVRDQGFPRLNQLLNSYRVKRGCKIIHKQNGLRELVEVLKNNQSIGMTGDQGGKSGVVVDFLGAPASMPTGAVKLALKYDCVIIPVFYTRVKGLYTKVILDQVYEPKYYGLGHEEDVKKNLQELVKVFEKYIRRYPHEYLWTYKIWKYGKQKSILILSDGKTGHLRQSESVARLMVEKLGGRGIETKVRVSEVDFKGALWREAKRTGRLRDIYPDFVISCGSHLCGLNYAVAKFARAKSIVLMRPRWAGAGKFDLAVIPRHDWPEGRGLSFDRQSHWPQGRGLPTDRQSHNPKQAKNIVITEGAMNLVDKKYLDEQSEKLGLRPAHYFGLLLGGDAKKFRLKVETVSELIKQLKQAAQGQAADILVTTSRRTPKAVEELVKKEFGNYPRCKLLVIANEKNIPEAVGGILGLSSVVICSPESISMISEAVNSAKYVIVFKANGLSGKHRGFLNCCSDSKYIYLSEASEIKNKIIELTEKRPEIILPMNNQKVSEALDRIL